MNERELFLTAVDIEDPAARQAHLRAECAGDAELLARVEALLASHEGQSQFLNTPVVEQIAIVSDSVASATIVYENGSTHDGDPDATTLYSNGTAPMTKPQDDAEFETALGYLEPSSKPGSLGRLGHYEVLEVIGRGAFGTVLRAFDEKLHRIVAIKVMSPEMASTSPARKRFLREAQASAAIRHEHVVSVYAVEEKPLPYLVMEFIPGETLQQRLDARGPLDVPTVLHLGRQIAEGLAAAHAQELIHRDIKPGNILLETSVHDRIKITDFGLARAADDASLTQSGTIAGTPMYMAPEQALGQKLDQRADLFSFGSVLYQMVSGRPPFRANGTLAVLKRLAEDTPRPIREIIPEVPQWLCDIITKLHAKNPDQRFQSAREIADVLANCESQLKSHAGLKDFSLIPQAKTPPATWWKWIAAAAFGLIAFGLMYVASGLGIGAFLVSREASLATPPKVVEKGPIKPPTTDPIKSESDPSSIVTASQKTPPLAIAPFDAAQARASQEGWARHLGIDVEITNRLVGKMILIPPGEFLMGTTPEQNALGQKILEGDSNSPDPNISRRLPAEMPQHRVVLTKPFFMASTEVTVARFRKFVDATGYETTADREGSGNTNQSKSEEVPAGSRGRNWRMPGVPQADEGPVSQVTWNDACVFCNWLSEQEQLSSWYQQDSSGLWRVSPQADGYRLPTEAEWEYACRAGTTTQFSFGDDPADLARYAWNRLSNNDGLQPVGTKLPNPFGLYDMHGNVSEFCQDAFDEKWYGISPELDPLQKNGTGPVARGGNWYVGPFECRSASRKNYSRAHRYWSLGFRVVRPINARSPESKSTSVLDSMNSLPKTFTSRTGMEFVVVPKGKSWLGGGKDKLGDREVEIPADFYLGKYEVTQEEWTQVMGENPSHFSRTGGGKEAVIEMSDADLKRFPVETVSWDECQLFVAKLNQLENETGWVYRLPTATEWEYACRGGPMTDKANSAFDFYFAKPTNNPLREQSSFGKNMGLNRTGKVGSHEANGLGIFDMHRNVWEWCDDTKEAADGNIQRVQLGGGWNHLRWRSAAANSESELPSHRSNALGLRLARVPSGVPSPKVNTPQSAIAPFTEADLKRIAALPAADQVEEVRKELKKRNPEFDGTLTPTIENDVVTGLEFLTQHVADISPVRAFPGLTSLNCRADGSALGMVSDLKPLKGMPLVRLTLSVNPISDLTPLKGMPLTDLHIDNSDVADLSPLEGMPLKVLNCSYTKVSSLQPLKGMPLVILWCNNTQIADLSPVKGMQLEWITIQETKITDFSPLKGMPLTQIYLDFQPDRDTEFLRAIRSLTKINDKPVAEFWKEFEQK